MHTKSEQLIIIIMCSTRVEHKTCHGGYKWCRVIEQRMQTIFASGLPRFDIISGASDMFGVIIVRVVYFLN